MKTFPRPSKKGKFSGFPVDFKQSAQGGTLEFALELGVCTFSPENLAAQNWTEMDQMTGKEWTYPGHSGSISLTFINSRTRSLSNSGTLVHSCSLRIQNGSGDTKRHGGGMRLVRWIRNLVSRKLPWLQWQSCHIWEHGNSEKDLVYPCNPLFYENPPLFDFYCYTSFSLSSTEQVFPFKLNFCWDTFEYLGHSS